MYRMSAIALLLILGGCSSLMMTGDSSGYANSAGEQSTSSTAGDSAITAEVKARHRDDPVLGTSNVGVRTVKGQVTLTGTVGTYEARNQAYRLARQVNGVTAVINQVRVEEQSN